VLEGTLPIDRSSLLDARHQRIAQPACASCTLNEFSGSRRGGAAVARWFVREVTPPLSFKVLGVGTVIAIMPRSRVTRRFGAAEFACPGERFGPRS
jgi:hypothetical protein